LKFEDYRYSSSRRNLLREIFSRRNLLREKIVKGAKKLASTDFDLKVGNRQTPAAKMTLRHCRLTNGRDSYHGLQIWEDLSLQMTEALDEDAWKMDPDFPFLWHSISYRATRRNSSNQAKKSKLRCNNKDHTLRRHTANKTRDRPTSL
jgi:hypothetical protein